MIFSSFITSLVKKWKTFFDFQDSTLNSDSTKFLPIVLVLAISVGVLLSISFFEQCFTLVKGFDDSIFDRGLFSFLHNLVAYVFVFFYIIFVYVVIGSFVQMTVSLEMNGTWVVVNKYIGYFIGMCMYTVCACFFLVLLIVPFFFFTTSIGYSLFLFLLSTLVCYVLLPRITTIFRMYLTKVELWSYFKSNLFILHLLFLAFIISYYLYMILYTVVCCFILSSDLAYLFFIMDTSSTTSVTATDPRISSMLPSNSSAASYKSLPSSDKIYPVKDSFGNLFLCDDLGNRGVTECQHVGNSVSRSGAPVRMKLYIRSILGATEQSIVHSKHCTPRPVISIDGDSIFGSHGKTFPDAPPSPPTFTDPLSWPQERPSLRPEIIKK
uniref:Uncharacterized protein n=1 Tax=Tsukubamonas globosa TaxID=875863 RepID=W8VJW7_9EUKA|nr:hypothetical protein [Tsukubamonas globosa]BAO51995.1 hypothetical protein [Tsukubamonas globosa]